MSATSKTYTADERTLDMSSAQRDEHSEHAFTLVTAMTDRLLALVVPALVIWVGLIAFTG